MRYELFIALRQIRAKKFQTFLSIGAIGIAVMILTLSQALMVGFTEELYDATVEKLPHVAVAPKAEDDYIYLYKTLINDINKIEGVSGVSPFLSGEASFRYRDNTRNAELKGVIPFRENLISNLEAEMLDGKFAEIEFSENSVILGSSLAEKLEVRLGDRVEVSFPNAKVLSFRVVGLFETGTPLDESLAYCSLQTAQNFYQVPDVVNGISVRLKDFNRDREVAAEIEKRGYEAKGWTETNPEILRTLALETGSNNITLGLIIVIASFGVISSLNLSVIGATKQIGMLRAMGATVSGIRLIFLLESSLLGFLGALVGTLSGVLLAIWIGNYELPTQTLGGISTIPAVIRPEDLFIIITAVFLLNLLGGIYPAQQAAKLDPVKALSTR